MQVKAPINNMETLDILLQYNLVQEDNKIAYFQDLDIKCKQGIGKEVDQELLTDLGIQSIIDIIDKNKGHEFKGK